ncbi:putative lipid II flippase FtsW [Oscillospiraceae bacterium CM]|nr:putative lipid II flippase FtsW [Oscillospiraceae bacterium CM]
MTTRGTKQDRAPSQKYDDGERLANPQGGETRLKRGSFDLPFFVLTLVILTIGVVMVLSASFASAYYTSGNPTKYFARQLFFAVTGVAIMIFVSKIKVATFRKYAFVLFVIAVVLLAAVPIIGTKENGAKRWIDLGFTTFQPSEVLKLAEVLLFAVMICVYKEKMKTLKYGVLPFAGVVALVVGLLFLEPHLSASVIIVLLAAIMMFAGGTKARWFVLAAIVVAAVALITVTQFSYASERITAWLHPEADPGDAGYQVLQSLYAIGSGGLFGLGLGQGRQKYLYLPEEHNDYIFAVICEELGYIGAIIILLLFALLIVRGFWLALHAKDRFGSLVITGLTSLLAIQVFLNVAVVTNLLPSTGISLPFFSYGGTALWLQLVEMGMILSISRDIPILRAG